MRPYFTTINNTIKEIEGVRAERQQLEEGAGGDRKAELQQRMDQISKQMNNNIQVVVQRFNHFYGQKQQIFQTIIIFLYKSFSLEFRKDPTQPRFHFKNPFII